ncbi:substrate-binding periplasmic protein [Conchiformibius kuhniae]|uniref:Substrate-binding periplasmic protein n=1 Tax=Conchiformibius kuhniae TaxID=211502 RepID=A0A8T9MRK9_9NEIS|nr:transporter substrate-binding domain-containing protein [Conchiformibius kuhniae]UOP04227.1 transporter substrate-binding domain-containing protein [Conchiformibius kuhniae]
MKKLIVSLTCAVLLAACGKDKTDSAAEVSAPAFAAVKTYKVTSYVYTPFVIRNSKGEVGGFETEVLQAVAAKQNIRFEFSPMLAAWDVLFKSVESGQADLLSAAMYPNPERAARFEVSDSYMDTRFALLSAKGIIVNGLADLRGKRLAVFAKSMADREIRSLSYADEIKIVPINSIYEGVKAVVGGKADVVYGDQVVLTYYANQFKDEGLRLSADPKAQQHQFIFLIRKGDTELLAQVNAGLAAIKADGTLEKIKNKWLAR